MARKALITGITGQDGAYLARFLLGIGYDVTGAVAPGRAAAPRLGALGIAADIRLIAVDLGDQEAVDGAMRAARPDEVYNLAGKSFVASSFEDPGAVASVNAVAPARLLRAIRVIDSAIRFYQASSSEMFGGTETSPQSETTPFQPRNPYAASKLFGHWVTVNHRERFGLHASSGICFNHESPLRSPDFLSRKVTLGLARIRGGAEEVLELGNLDARRDWGFAGDYVEGMWRMVQAREAGDYVLATGRSHTVREFVDFAAQAAGFRISWEGHGLAERAVDRATGRVLVRTNRAFYRPPETTVLLGDPSRAREALGWSADMSLPELARMMMEEDCRRVRDDVAEF